MKRILIAVMAVALASSAVAAVSIELGSNWFKPNLDPNGADYDFFGQGQNLTIAWTLDSDISVGIYMENTQLMEVYDGYMYPFTVNAIQLRKGIVKNVDLGMNLGTFYEDYDSESGVLTDIFGEVTVLSGKSDKIEGALRGQVGGRWADAGYQNGSGANWNGYFVNLLVALVM
jgi:hypothetical protein